ncbi:MAG: hypothetical protein ABI268_13310 [Rhodanobacter sp.]
MRAFLHGIESVLEAPYEGVFAAVVEGLAWMRREATAYQVAKSSIGLLRSKIGHVSLKGLRRRACPGA